MWLTSSKFEEWGLAKRLSSEKGGDWTVFAIFLAGFPLGKTYFQKKISASIESQKQNLEKVPFSMVYVPSFFAECVTNISPSGGKILAKYSLKRVNYMFIMLL